MILSIFFFSVFVAVRMVVASTSAGSKVLESGGARTNEKVAGAIFASV
jgi:hypothetical protein